MILSLLVRLTIEVQRILPHPYILWGTAHKSHTPVLSTHPQPEDHKQRYIQQSAYSVLKTVKLASISNQTSISLEQGIQKAHVPLHPLSHEQDTIGLLPLLSLSHGVANKNYLDAKQDGHIVSVIWQPVRPSAKECQPLCIFRHASGRVLL